MLETTKNIILILNIIVRILPVCLYGATFISGILTSHSIMFILLLGHVLNDIISYGYRRILKSEPITQCAFIKIGNVHYTLPSSHVQIISYYVMFFFLDMRAKDDYDIIKILFLLTLLGITIWSRINIGCESFMDTLFAMSMGATIALLYFMFVKDYLKIPDTIEQEIGLEVVNDTIDSVFNYFE